MNYDAERLEIYTSGAWLDISDYVSQNHTLSWARGIMGNGVLDRIARPGQISFVLHDTTGQFDPINSAAILTAGTQIRFVLDSEGITRVMWYGKVRNVAPREDDLFRSYAQVTGFCFLDEFNRPLVTPGITTNKTASQVTDEIIGDLGLTVSATQKQYGTMTRIFPSVFDTVRSKQNALGEISKAVLSELGYIAVRGTRTEADNFILTIDGRDTRENRAYITIPKGTDQSGFALMEDGSYLLQEDSARIILDESLTFDEFATITDKQLAYGKNIVNDCIVTVYPREYSASAEVLYSLTSAPGIDVGETREILARYRDPDNTAQSITARTMLAPVANTDYTANAVSDGSGADLTSDLSVTAIYSAAEINYTLENTGATKLFITKLQARGEGIFFYSPVTLQAEDTTSQAANGYRVLAHSPRYLDDVDDGQEIANAIIASAKDVFSDVDWIEIDANASSENLFAAMYLDIGDPLKITLKDAAGNMTARKFYINGINWSGTRGAWKVRYTTASQEVTEL